MKKIEKKFLTILKQMYPDNATFYPYNTKYSKRIVKFLKQHDEQLSMYCTYSNMIDTCTCDNISATITLDGKNPINNKLYYETLYEQNNQFSKELINIIKKNSEIKYREMELHILFHLNQIPIHKYLNLSGNEVLSLFKNMYSQNV